MAQPQQPDIAAFLQAGWERNGQLAAAVIVVFEYVIQFGNEVDYFWRRRWSFPKYLFLWGRYFSVGFSVGNAVVFLQKDQDPTVSEQFFHWQNAGACLQTITTHLILELRLYAMYGNSRKILALFVVMGLCEIAVMGVIFGVPFPGLVGTNNPFPGLYICADADPSNGHHWIAYFPTFNLVIETIFLSLAVFKAWSQHKSGGGGRMMMWLTTESVGYFMMIIWVHVVNQVLWIVNRITLNELGTGISFAIPAVLANRLLISVRAKHDHPNDFDDTYDESVKPSIRFLTVAPASHLGIESDVVSAGAGTGIELTSMTPGPSSSLAIGAK